MRKLLTILAILTLLMVSAVFAVGQVSILTPVANVQASPASTATLYVNVTNTLDNSIIPSVDVSSTELKMGTTTIAAPATVTITDLVNKTPQQAALSIPISPGQAAGTYTSKVTAMETGNPNNNKTISYTLTVRSIGAITFGQASVNLFGSPGDEVEQRFTIKNDGNVKVTNINITHEILELTDSDDNEIDIDFSPYSVPELLPGASAEILVTADIPGDMEVKTFNDNIIVKSSAAEARLPMAVKSQLGTCVNGINGKLDVSFDSPDSDDSFSPGEEIPVEIVVKNRGSDDKDVVVEAFLYNLDDNNEVDSDDAERNIDEDDSYIFKLKLKMDSKTGNNNDDYKIFVKAYEDGEEDTQCDQRTLSIQKEVLDDEIKVDSFTISPVTAACGDIIEALLQLKNTGSNDEDNVRVTLQNAYIGLNQLSEVYSIPSDEDGDSTIAYVRMSFTVPKTAKDGNYVIGATVNYDGLPETASQTLTLQGCSVVEQKKEDEQKSDQQLQTLQPIVAVNPNVNYEGKGLFEAFNTSLNVPDTFWLLADVLIFLGIIALLVVILTPRRRH